MKRRRTTLVVVAVVVAAVGGVGAVKGTEAYRNRCGAGTELVSESSPEPAFDDVADAGFEGSAAEFVAAARTLGAPFGELRTGRAVDDDEPQVVAAGPRVLLVPRTGPFGVSHGSFTSVSLPGGERVWSRSMEDSNVSGAMVGELFVTGSIPHDRAPEVIAYVPRDGHQISCVKLGPGVAQRDRPPFAIQDIDDDVLAVYPSGLDDDDPRLSLSRVEPATGDIAWTTEITTGGIDPDDAAGIIDVLDDVAVVSTRDLVTSNAMELTTAAHAEDPTTPTVLAYSTADGQFLWGFPEATVGPGQFSQVIGVDEETGTIVVATGHDDGSGLVRTYSGLDAAGTVLWSRVGGGQELEPASVWGSTVVLPYFGPAGTTDGVMTAESGVQGWSVNDGTDQWISSDGAMGNMREAVEVGNYWVFRSGTNLRAIDPVTGDGADYPLPLGYHSLTVTDDHLVMAFLGGLLVFDRT